MARIICKKDAEKIALEKINAENMQSEHRAFCRAAIENDRYQFAKDMQPMIVKIAKTVSQILVSPRPLAYSPKNNNASKGTNANNNSNDKPQELDLGKFYNAIRYLCCVVVNCYELYGIFKDARVNEKANRQKHDNEDRLPYDEKKLNIPQCVNQYNRLINLLIEGLEIECFEKLKISGDEQSYKQQNNQNNQPKQQQNNQQKQQQKPAQQKQPQQNNQQKPVQQKQQQDVVKPGAVCTKEAGTLKVKLHGGFGVTKKGLFRKPNINRILDIEYTGEYQVKKLKAFYYNGTEYREIYGMVEGSNELNLLVEEVKIHPLRIKVEAHVAVPGGQTQDLICKVSMDY